MARLAEIGSSSGSARSEEHTSELQSLTNLVCRLLLEKKKNKAFLLCHASLLASPLASVSLFFFFNDTATTEIYTLSLHDALPICLAQGLDLVGQPSPLQVVDQVQEAVAKLDLHIVDGQAGGDRLFLGFCQIGRAHV